MIKSIIYSTLLITVLTSCFSNKSTNSKSGKKKFFETFFVGKEGTQYFIKPIHLEHVESNDILSLDFTFRYKDEVKDSATVNFSIDSEHIYKSIDSLLIINDITALTSQNVILIFKEKNKKTFTSRFSSKYSLLEVKELFENNQWKIFVFHQDQVIIFEAHKKSRKKINNLNNLIFSIM